MTRRGLLWRHNGGCRFINELDEMMRNHRVPPPYKEREQDARFHIDNFGGSFSNIYELLQPGRDYIEIRRVDSKGTIRVPMVGKIEVAGLTAEEIRSRLAASIVEKKLVRSPKVRVAIRLSEQLQPLQKDHHLVPGDLIMVKVFELQKAGIDYNDQLEVDETGAINIPQLGKVQVRGITTRLLEDKIAELCVAKGIFHKSTAREHVRVNMSNDEAMKRFVHPPGLNAIQSP